MTMSPDELHGSIHGLLSFPVTPVTPDDTIDIKRFREHLEYLSLWNPGALFVCGGTGEFFSLSLEEYRGLVKAAVEEVGGKIPVIAGAGYGAKLAAEFAAAAESEGADGIMVMPPYLLNAEQEGLYQHYRRIAEGTKLGLVVYQRDNAIFEPETVSRLAEIPNVIGFKDGHGDMERLFRIRLAVGDELVFVNGMPTAEMSARGFFGVGVHHYSSAVFNFVPELARAFYDAAVTNDEKQMTRLANGFYLPFIELRNKVKGYAVSLIKAGLKVKGNPVGPARPPLVNPSSDHEAELKAIVEQGLSLVRS